MYRLIPLSLICTLLMAGVARSTTVIPPTFESLVSRANTIFVGEVMDATRLPDTSRPDQQSL